MQISSLPLDAALAAEIDEILCFHAAEGAKPSHVDPATGTCYTRLDPPLPDRESARAVTEAMPRVARALRQLAGAIVVDPLSAPAHALLFDSANAFDAAWTSLVTQQADP